MVQTIQVSTCLSVQGLVVRRLDDGRVVIRVGDRSYAGLPLRAETRPVGPLPQDA